MANQIRMTTDQRRTQAAELRSCACSTEQNMQKIQKVIDSVTKGWSGDAIQENVTRIQNELESMYMLQNRVMALAEMLEQAASVVEESESQIASMFHF
jgi:uncharacterized protein YukE